MANQNVRKLVEAALLLALATVLTILSKFIPLQLPFGGSVTLVSMLPVVLISYRQGVKWGLLSAFVFAIIQIFTGLDTVKAFFMPGDSQMVVWKALCVVALDYFLAYTVLGLAGMFRNKLSPVPALCWGSAIALALRYLAHTISGAIFFGSWAEWFFTDEFKLTAVGDFIMEHFSGTGLALVYSVIYNGLYMIPEIILTVIAAAIVAKIPTIAKKYEDA